MKKGLVLGKFYPLHLGHLGLIDFASKRCDKLYVLLCVNEKEDISGTARLWWLSKLAEKYTNVELKFTDVDLPSTSVSDCDISKLWAEYLKTILDFDIIFTSEKYGDYVAEILGIEHIPYNVNRDMLPISGTLIRENPFKYWDHLPEYVKPYFVKKIAIVGTESTGKSTLAQNLAKHFDTNFVPEWGRIVVNKTDECTYRNLLDIGYLHAKDISEKRQTSNKLLFSDTELNTTKIYSDFLFNEDIKFDKWIEDTNKFDLYLFLNNDAPYIQDGTRLSRKERDRLQDYYLNYFNNDLHIILGSDWDVRTKNAIDIVKMKFGI